MDLLHLTRRRPIVSKGWDRHYAMVHTPLAIIEIPIQVSRDLQLARPACVLLDKQMVVCLSALAQQTCLLYSGLNDIGFG
jgi:hypothetical protein